jgi:hypothetical protein
MKGWPFSNSATSAEIVTLKKTSREQFTLAAGFLSV